MVRRCCVGGCKSIYDSESEVVPVHSFPTNVDERQTWVDALPNILSKSPPTRDMVVCVKHWPPNYKTKPKKGHHVPVHLPSVFSLPKYCASQTASTTSRDIEVRKVDSESRSSSAKQLELKRDFIVSWEKLEIFCKTLDVTVINSEESLILTEVVGIPPKMTLSLQSFKDYSISCYKGYTKVTYNDLINSFTHKIEKYSQVIDIIKRLKEAEYNLSEELKGVAANIQAILDLDENLDECDEEKIKFLIDQMSQGKNMTKLE